MPETRILVKGRLGNQMFIYAFARALSFEADVTPILLNDYLNQKQIKNRLDCFRLSSVVQFGSNTHLNSIQKFLLWITKNASKSKRHALELRMKPLLAKNGIFKLVDGYSPLPERRVLESKDFYMEGYFQSELYFLKHKNEVLRDFEFKQSLIDSCNAMALKIQNACEPTCLHVRLGDYVNHPLHGVADVDYYKKALSRLKEQKPKAQIFLFSDNMELAKSELNLGEEVICLPEEYDDQQTMYIGSLCKNFIMSNSSFSWWMQYLSSYKEKNVIAPSRWYAKNVPCDIFLNNWQLIEV